MIRNFLYYPHMNALTFVGILHIDMQLINVDMQQKLTPNIFIQKTYNCIMILFCIILNQVHRKFITMSYDDNVDILQFDCLSHLYFNDVFSVNKECQLKFSTIV